MNELSADDRLAIIHVICDFTHMVDNQDFDRIGDVFTEDFHYDRSNLGAPDVDGHDGVRASLQGKVAFNHLSTDICIRGPEGDGVGVDSKFFAFLRDGTLATGAIHDVVVRTDLGWRLSRRCATPRHAGTFPTS